MMGAASRLDDVTGEDKRHMLRPSELKQMELQKYHDVCSEIVPKQVYVSSYKVASDLAVLQRHGITHILNLAADICDNRFPDKFFYSTYYVKDASGEDISMLFYRTLEWMQASLLSGGRVLVHCREGVSRSATMVIAYLMWANNMPFKEAQEVIRSVRPICNPNPGFTYHLLELGKRLGTGTPGRPTSGPQTMLFRVRPHHPQNPFLLLEPSQKPQSPPVFDPRFGWVVRCDKQLVLWLGSQVPDVEAVQATVLQHAQYYETFEKSKYNVTIMQEGQETPVLWQTLGLPPVQKGKPALALAAVRPIFDQDYEVTRRAAGRPV
jgi:protein-tyrosine phosphatase